MLGIEMAVRRGPHGPGPAASYLRASWVLRAGGGGVQSPDGQLPYSGHCACSDVALRVLQELLGELRHLGSQERLSEAGLSWGAKGNSQL